MWLAGTGLSPGNQHLGAGQEHSDPKRKHSSLAQPDPRPRGSEESLGRCTLSRLRPRLSANPSPEMIPNSCYRQSLHSHHSLSPDPRYRLSHSVAIWGWRPSTDTGYPSREYPPDPRYRLTKVIHILSLDPACVTFDPGRRQIPYVRYKFASDPSHSLSPSTTAQAGP